MCYVTIHKPAVRYEIGHDIFYRVIVPILRSISKISVFGWDDGHHPSFKPAEL